PLVAKSEQAEEEIFKSLKMNGLVNQDANVLGFMDENLAGTDGNLRASVKSSIVPVETNKDGGLTKRSSVADGKQIMAMVNFVNQKLVQDSRQILEGDTALNPYKSGDMTACKYCEYKSACGFDLRVPGNQYRNLAKKSVEEIKEEIWGSTSEEV
ncbi:MAG: hypothetical protein WBI07_02895, partial [Mobilitalea sp.]